MTKKETLDKLVKKFDSYVKLFKRPQAEDNRTDARIALWALQQLIWQDSKFDQKKLLDLLAHSNYEYLEFIREMLNYKAADKFIGDVRNNKIKEMEEEYLSNTKTC